MIDAWQDRARGLVADVGTLVFDVMGTVLDERPALEDAISQLGLDVTTDGAAVLAEWTADVGRQTEDILAGRRRYQPPEELYHRSLRALLERRGTTLAPEAVSRIASFGTRLTAFPDSIGALDRLAADRPLVALTNAGTAQALRMSFHAGLRWSVLLCGDMVEAYKPDPRMYRYAIDLLRLDPGRTLFVAAHDWDLDAAAVHGFRTAYVRRSGPRGSGGRFDLELDDLTALADLACPDERAASAEPDVRR